LPDIIPLVRCLDVAKPPSGLPPPGGFVLRSELPVKQLMIGRTVLRKRRTGSPSEVTDKKSEVGSSVDGDDAPAGSTDWKERLVTAGFLIVCAVFTIGWLAALAWVAYRLIK
jgi:hypothetical protein